MSIPVLVVITGAWSGPAVGDDPVRIQMNEGEQRIFEVSGLVKLTVPEGGIVSVKKLSSDKFIVYAQQEGRASIGIIRKGRASELWEVVVRSTKVRHFKASCAELLGEDSCADLRVIEAGGKVVLDGQVKSLETYHKVRKLKEAFPEVVIMVEVEASVLDALVEVLNRELEKAGLDNVRVVRVARRLIMEGTVADDMERRKAEVIVNAIYDEALGGD